MATSQLPTPGRLILENITLLAGSPTAFHSRYGFTLTSTTFSKPGNTGPANAVLHFLISIIDADVAESLFKPCFPILERDQERDFRKVVDARLAILERTKLLPAGSARKSVVAAAGGDRFLDLLWSLSSLALQQACLRHPAYGSVSRMRLFSHQTPSDSSQSSTSQHSVSRSSRSLLSGLSARSERSSTDPSRHRRFLGVGMLSASMQRQKDAEEMRARIDSERIALTRTTEMGQHGSKTWASEADSLREKIGEFEAKLRRLKGQLADMGFDENGVDIRAAGVQESELAAVDETKAVRHQADTGGPLVSSSSADELGDELKTSPIESTESCSSVDDAGDACDDLAADLSRLLSFTVESHGQRGEVENAVETAKPVIPFTTNDSTSRKGADIDADAAEGQDKVRGVDEDVDEDVVRDEDQDADEDMIRDPHHCPKSILYLVRVATDELVEATNRMHEIREAREKAESDVPTDSDVLLEANILTETGIPKEAERDTGVDERLEQRYMTTEHDKKGKGTGGEADYEADSLPISSPQHEALPSQRKDIPIEDGPLLSSEDPKAPLPSPHAENAGSSLEGSVPLKQKAARVLEEHNNVVESSRRLQKEAAMFSSKTAPASSKEIRSIATDSSANSFVGSVAKPHWYTTAAASSTKAKKGASRSGTKKHRKSPKGGVNTLSDVSVAAKAMQGCNPSQSSHPSTIRRRKEGTKSLDFIDLNFNSLDKQSQSCEQNHLDALYSPSESNGSLKSTPRSVRFAELPPSYSASRTSDNSREGSPIRRAQGSDKQLVESVTKALEERSADKCQETYSQPQDVKGSAGGAAITHLAERENHEKDEKNNTVPRKAYSTSQKSEVGRRAHLNPTKGENGRKGTVSSKKPPRVQRTRTTHRVVRRKEMGQHAPVLRQHSPANARPFSSRSASLDNISSLRGNPPNTVLLQGTQQRSLTSLEGTKAEGKSPSLDSLQRGTSEVLTGNESRGPKCDTSSTQTPFDEKSEDGSTGTKESVQKKLFMTPDSAISSTNKSKPLSRLSGGRKQDFTRRSSTGVLHLMNRDNLASSGDVVGSDVTAVVKDSSVEFSSTDDEELLFTPAGKATVPQKVATPKIGGGGFFAGQTAEWQQSVRAQCNRGGQSAGTSAHSSSDAPGRMGRSSGKGSSSGMRSRVQSFRARLAALK